MSQRESGGQTACASGGSAPTLSVVMPTYNRADLVIEAIGSVRRQSFQDFEIIIVDDASDDDTVERVNALADERVQVIRHDVNRGAGAARNTGIKAARGRYIAFLDSDDLWTLDKVERQLGFLRENAGRFGASCTGWLHCVPGAKQPDVRAPAPLLEFEDLLLGCRCAPGTTLIAETALVRQAGPFNEAMARLEDWEWLLRLSKLSPVGVLREPLAVVIERRRDRRNYNNVRQSAELLWSWWREGEGLEGLEGLDGRGAGGRNERILRATIANELAAAAYQSGRYIAAARFLAMSLWLLPERGLGFYKRIVARIGRDAAAAAGLRDMIAGKAELIEIRR